MMRNLSNNACYETCRFIMSEGATVEQGQARAQAVLNRLGNVQATILINGADGSRNEDGEVIGEINFDTPTVETQIEIRFADNTLILPANMFGDSTIRTRMTMRTERFAGFFDASEAN